MQGLLGLVTIGGVISGAVVAGTLAGAGMAVRAGSAPIPASAAAAVGSGQAAPVAPSTPEQRRLVEHLRRQGAVFYGAWWCPHCTHQKDLFGPAAAERLPYVECDRDDAGRQRCAAAAVRVFPTWDLNGERREGLLTIEELRIWSGYAAGR
jgi:hypothetical protein